MKYSLLSLVFVAFISSAQEQVEDYYEQANTAFTENQLDDSYIFLKNSLQKDPNHLPSKILMGKVLALSFYYEDAIDVLYESLQAGADPNLIIEFLANSLLAQKRYDDIIALSDIGLSKKNRAVLYALKGKSENRLEQPVQAQKYFEQALNTSSTIAGVTDAYAKFLLEHNRLSEAKQFALKAVELESSNAESVRTLAAIYRREGNVNAYVDALNQALMIDKDQPLVLRDLVTAYIRLNQAENAKRVIESILESSPNDPMAKFLFSWANSQLGESDIAQSTLEDLVNNLSLIDADVMQNAHGLLYINGMANLALGNTDLAQQNLQNYVNKQPNDLNASILLADLYAQEGNSATSIKLLENFKELTLTNLKLSDKLCNLYIEMNLTHKCAFLLDQMDENFSLVPDFISLKAKLLAAQGKPSEALNQMSQLENESEQILVDRALLSIQAGNYELAKSTLSKLIENAELPNDYKNLLASVHIKEGDNSEAKALLDDILSSNPSHFSALFNLATVNANLGNYGLAKTSLETLHELRKNDSNVVLMLAKLERRMGNIDAALDYANEAIVLDRNMTEAKLELIAIYQFKGDFESAISVINPIIKQEFLDPQYIALRANLFIQSKQFDKASSDLNVLFGIYSADSDSLFDLAIMQRNAKDFSGALKSLDRAIELSPKKYPLYRDKTNLFIQTQQFDKASASLEITIDKFGHTPDTYLFKGHLAMVENDPKEAAELYYKSVEQDNFFSLALVQLYGMATSGYKEQEFVSLMESIIVPAARTDMHRHLLADFYLLNKQNAKAKPHYLAIIKHGQYKFTPQVMNNLANIYMQEEEYETAMDLSLKAHNKQPNDPAILDTYGWSLVKLGKFDEGLSYLRQSFAMNTADPAIRFHIAVALSKLNRIAEAKRELTNLLENFDMFEDRDEAQALLNSL